MNLDYIKENPMIAGAVIVVILIVIAIIAHKAGFVNLIPEGKKKDNDTKDKDGAKSSGPSTEEITQLADKITT